jgi:TRAP-type C4-dicarboxylate transport system permease small subunit
MAVPVGFSLMIFRLIQSFVRDVRDLFAGRAVFEGNKMFD